MDVHKYLEIEDVFLVTVEGDFSELDGSYKVGDASRGNMITSPPVASRCGFAGRWKEHQKAPLRAAVGT